MVRGAVVSVVLGAMFLVLVVAVAAPAPPVGAQDGAFVLVKRSAFLHAQPDARAEKVRDAWGTRWAQRLGPFVVARFVAERGDWVEVATIPSFRATEHCYGTIPGIEGLDLRFFVRAADVAPVTATRITRSFDDGSRITLLPGVGLQSRGRNRYEASVRGASVRVELQASEIGRRYDAGTKLSATRMIGLLHPGASMSLANDVRIQTEAGPRRPRAASGTITFTAADARGGGGEPPRAVFAVDAPPQATGPRITATIRTDCLEATGIIRGNDITRDRPTRPAADVGGHRGTSLQLGTALYWPDGAQAGRVAAPAALDGSPTPAGPKICFDHPLRTTAGRPGADETLTLCVDRAAATRRTARRF